MQTVVNKISSILSSRRFFIFIIAFFLFEGIWIAVSATYPQAFDESFHFGLIQTYSHYWLPFLSQQPSHANAYGAVARDPSYLYHYLMSFPYRIIALFVHYQAAQIIILRIINVGLFAAGLILFRKVLLRTGISSALTNISLLLVTLIPVAPQLAGQINYDNMLIPLVAWVCLLTFKLTDEVRQKKPTVKTIVTLATVCLFSSLVKYEFLPIFAGTLVYLVLLMYQHYHWNFREVSHTLVRDFKQQSRHMKYLLIAMLVISTGFFMQRDGLNIIKYHTIAPDCSVVLNVQDCSAYSVWEHDYTSHNAVVSAQATASRNPITYTWQWMYWLWYRLFFGINGVNSGYTNYPPLPLPSAAFALVVIFGLIYAVKLRKKIFSGNNYILFISIITGLYLLALLVEGYMKYEYTDVLELMNGRYLLPIIPIVAAIAGSAFSVALQNRKRLKVYLAVAAIFLFVQGGGFLTFLTLSDSTWDWQNSAVVKINNDARKLANIFVFNGKKTYTTKLWFFN